MNWLETRLASPSFAGWVLLVLGGCFFLAATNTLSGWLFVMAGLSLALFLLAAVVSRRQLRSLTVTSIPSDPVSVGMETFWKLEVENPSRITSALFTVVADLPAGIAALDQVTDPLTPVKRTLPVDTLQPQSKQGLQLHLTPQRRGIYTWPSVYLRSGAPLGLTWARRPVAAATHFIVYPEILNLVHCPLMEAGTALEQQPIERRQPLARAANEGTTRSLRPYRRGDPMRYIHWRTSARFGELRTRELESIAGGQPLLLVLDHRVGWGVEAFEQAVITAASLYTWGSRRGMDLALWIESGEVRGDRTLLTTLAGIQPTATGINPPKDTPQMWLTVDPALAQRALDPSQQWWLGWGADWATGSAGLLLEVRLPLQEQLQRIPVTI